MKRTRACCGAALVAAAALAGCAANSDADVADGGGVRPDRVDARDGGTDAPSHAVHDDLPYARELVSFAPGVHAGFGQANLPGVVFGPPGGGGARASLDVVSLGVGGHIVVGFGDRDIVDGPGPDFVVFENAFYIAGTDRDVFAELGEVSVSQDGKTWAAFACDPERAAATSCAGQTPTETYDPAELVPLDPLASGGDAFDLADLDIEWARFVRIRDRATEGAGNNAGFDLDAVGLVHHRRAVTQATAAPSPGHTSMDAGVDAGESDAGEF